MSHVACHHRADRPQLRRENNPGLITTMLNTTPVALSDASLASLAAHVLPQDPGIESLRRAVEDNPRLPQAWQPGYASGRRSTILAGLQLACDHIRGDALVYEPCNNQPQGDVIDRLVTRRPAEVLNQQMANPLELCLLGAGLLESLGLYPVLALCHQTLLFGGWLVPRHAGPVMLTDPVQISRLLHAGDLLLLDATSLYGDNNATIEQLAADTARFVDAHRGELIRLLDVTAWRTSREDNSVAPPGAEDVYIRTRMPRDIDTDPDEADDSDTANFEIPVSAQAATAALAVALNQPRARADWSRLNRLDELSRPNVGATSGELNCVLPADGDQRLVVKAAALADSFCVIAPVGTGADETLVNLAAQLMGRKRSVLILSTDSNKVQHLARLTRQGGISALCDIDLPGPGIADDHAQDDGDDESLDSVRKSLATLQRARLDYVARLHSPGHQQSGWSLHAALGICAQHTHEPPELVQWQDLDPNSLPTPAQLGSLGERLRTIDSEHLARAGDELAVIGHTAWTGQWEAELLDAAAVLAERSSELDMASGELARMLGLPGQPVARAQFAALQLLCETIPDCSSQQLALARHSDLPALREALTRAVDTTAQYDQLQRSLSADYRRDAELSLPIEQLQVRCERTLNSRWPRRSWHLRRLRRVLGRFAAGPVSPLDDIPVLAQMRTLREQLRADHQLVQHFASHWSDINSDFLSIGERLDDAEQLASTLATVLGDNASGDSVATLAAQVKGAQQHPDRVGQCTRYAALARAHQDALDAFLELARPSQRVSASGQFNWAGFVGQLARGVLNRRWDIKDWCAWREVTGGGMIAGYEPLMQRVARGEVNAHDAALAMQYACARCWLEKHLARNDPDLLDDMPVYQHGAQQHRDALDRYRALLARQLSAQVPTGHSRCVITTADRYPDRVDHERRRYDVVIFADAHQLSLTNAIPIMAYTDRAVFVGDPACPMQGEANERYDNLVSGVAGRGVLHAAIALGLPAVRLRHDYAARQPVLLAQANRISSQTAVRPLLPVSHWQPTLQLTQVENASWGQDTSDNEAEAKRLVVEVLATLRDCNPNDTSREHLQVVAMTRAQRARIADLLERAAHAETVPRVARALQQVVVRTADEPLDLSARVYFSTTAASPGATDHPVLDSFFGARGAQRLYNVICSARDNLHIFTSLGPEDLSGTDATLNPAIPRLGELLSEAANQATTDDTDDVSDSIYPLTAREPFSAAISRAMSARGWQTIVPSTVLGAGIDLFVENPDEPGTALAGIVTDAGFFMQTQPDVIRRDDCQERALLNAGWQLVPTWPQQWWPDAGAAEQQLDDALTALLARWRDKHHVLANTPHEPGEQYRRLSIVDVPNCQPDALLDESYGPDLRRIVQAVVRREGPIRHDILLRRIAHLHQRSRLTPAIKACIETALAGFASTRDGQYRFIRDAALQDSDIRFRPPASHEDKRQLSEIAPEELAAAARQFGINADAPNATRNLARAIGLAYPASSEMRSRLEQALRDARPPH